MSVVSNLSKRFLQLSMPAKAGIIGGTLATIYASAKIINRVPKVNGIPNVKNLKGFAPNMTRDEAEKILNLGPGSKQEDIKKRYTVLFALNAPDNGGSPYIATKLTNARDVLSLGQANPVA